jgi:hypothetical protein
MEEQFRARVLPDESEVLKHLLNDTVFAAFVIVQDGHTIGRRAFLSLCDGELNSHPDGVRRQNAAIGESRLMREYIGSVVLRDETKVSARANNGALWHCVSQLVRRRGIGRMARAFVPRGKMTS